MQSTNRRFLRATIFSFALLIMAAVAASLLLHQKVDNVAVAVSEHAQKMNVDSKSTSLELKFMTVLVSEINGLQSISYGLAGGAFATLFAALMAALWVSHKIDLQERLVEGYKLAEESDRRRKREFEALCNISGTLAGNGDFEYKATRYVEEFARVAEAEWLSLRMPDNRGEGLRFVVVGAGLAKSIPAALLNDSGSLGEEALRDGLNIVVNGYSAHSESETDITRLGVNSVALLPIFSKGGTLGLVTVFSKQIDHFNEARVKLLSDVLGGVRPLLENALLEDNQKHTEERLRGTARLASIGELAAGVAHEVNNPLTNILGYSQMLLNEDHPETFREDLETVISESQRAAKIIRNLQLFARRSVTDMNPAHINEILSRALDLKQHEFVKSEISVDLDLAEDLPKVLIDEHQLIQVIVNILTNAQQAMESIQRTRELSVRTTISGEKVRIRIQDSGPGIPPERKMLIFEPFYTTKEVGMGTGLGLSICHGIIQEHQGAIWSSSLPGQGATFNIELPAWYGQEEEQVSGSQPSAATVRHGHVLAVDDDPQMRNLLQRSLEQDEYEVDLAEDGAEAWKLIQANTYDCVLLDLKMPEMNGKELFRLMQGSPKGMADKVIFITGDTADMDSQEFVASYNNPVMQKPFQLDDLMSVVHEVTAEPTRTWAESRYES